MLKVARMISRIIWGFTALLACILLLPGVFGYTPYAVLSGSMEPQYPVGSVVYVTDVDPSSIREGDAVTFLTADGRTATHQAYEVDEDSRLIRTQGIANVNADGSIMHDADPVPFDRVIGTPKLCVPLLGYVANAVSGIAGKATLIILSMAALIPFVISRKTEPGNKPKHRKEPS